MIYDYLDEAKLGKMFKTHNPDLFFKGFMRFVEFLGEKAGKNPLNYEFTPFDDIIINNRMDGRRLRAEKYLPLLEFMYDDPQFVAFVCCNPRKNGGVYRELNFYDDTESTAIELFTSEYVYRPEQDDIDAKNIDFGKINISRVVRDKECIAGIITKTASGGKKLIEKGVQALSVAKPKLINRLLKKSSVHNDFIKALDEWILTDWEIVDDDCVCNQEHIHLGLKAVNTKTREELFPLGSVCSELFKDPRNLLAIGARDRTLTTRVYNTRKRRLNVTDQFKENP